MPITQMELKTLIENFEVQTVSKDEVISCTVSREPIGIIEKFMAKFFDKKYESYELKSITLVNERSDPMYLALKAMHDDVVLGGKSVFAVIAAHRDHNTEQWKTLMS